MPFDSCDKIKSRFFQALQMILSKKIDKQTFFLLFSADLEIYLRQIKVFQ